MHERGNNNQVINDDVPFQQMMRHLTQPRKTRIYIHKVMHPQYPHSKCTGCLSRIYTSRRKVYGITSCYSLQMVSSFTYSVKWQKGRMDKGNLDEIENRADRYWSFNSSRKKIVKREMKQYGG